MILQPKLRRPVWRGAGAPCLFRLPKENEGSRAPTGAGAEAPHPMTRLAVGSISGSPEMTGRIADRRASRRSAAVSSLRHRAALSAARFRAAISQLLAGGYRLRAEPRRRP